MVYLKTNWCVGRICKFYTHLTFIETVQLIVITVRSDRPYVIFSPVNLQAEIQYRPIAVALQTYGLHLAP